MVTKKKAKAEAPVTPKKVTHGTESCGTGARNKKEVWRRKQVKELSSDEVPSRDSDNTEEVVDGYDPCNTCRGL
jgi:hypothetical protein